MDICTFYIVRHGQTTLNLEKRLQGYLDSPLTEQGVLEAQETANLLEKIYFDAIFTSDLLRAKRTAEIIKLDRKLEIVETKLLRERSFGRFEGESIQGEVVKRFDALLDALTEEEKPHFKVDPEVESDNEIATRLIQFLRETAITYPGRTVLAATHAGIMRAFLIKLGYGDSKSLRYDAIRNSAYIVVESDGVDFFIKETYKVEKHE